MNMEQEEIEEQQEKVKEAEAKLRESIKKGLCVV